MAADESAVVEIALRSPKTIADIEAWAALAEAIGVPKDSPITLDHGPTYKRLTVTTFLTRTGGGQS